MRDKSGHSFRNDAAIAKCGHLAPEEGLDPLLIVECLKRFLELCKTLVRKAFDSDPLGGLCKESELPLLIKGESKSFSCGWRLVALGAYAD